MGGYFKVELPGEQAKNTVSIQNQLNAVNGLFTSAQQIANEYSEAAADALNTPRLTVESEDIDTQYVHDLIDTELDLGLVPSVYSATSPTLDENEREMASLDEFIQLVDTSIGSITMPGMNIDDISISIPAPPSDEIPNFDDVVVALDPITRPTMAAITLPDEPEFKDVVIPSSREIMEVPFEQNMPDIPLDEPVTTMAFSEVAYNSDVADQIKLWFLDQIGAGSTGLAEEIEAALWARAKDRNQEENEKQYDEAMSFWSNRGHEEAPGALRGRILRVGNMISRANQNINFEIMIEQGRLAQTNTHFVIEKGIAYEQILMDYVNKVNERALNAARAQIEADVSIFNAKVAYYNLKLDAYKTYSQVFEMKVRAELAKIEIYKAEMEGARIAQDIETNKVALYKARIEASLSLIEIFRAEMEGAKLQIETNKMHLEEAKLNVETKVARIQGITAKFGLYQSEIAGQKALVDLYGERVSAYKTEVEAKSVEANILIEQGKLKVEENKAKIEKLNAEIKKYEADILQLKNMNEAYIGLSAADLKAVEASISHFNAYAIAHVGWYRTRVEAATGELRGFIEEANQSLQASRANAEISQQAIDSAAKVQSQISASALSSISASASMGYSANESDSASRQSSRSITRLDGNKNIYNLNETVT